MEFTVILIALLGCISLFQGMLARFDEGYFVGGADQLFVDYDVWSVLLVVWGGLLLVAAAALGQGREWARIAALLAVMIQVVMQMGFVPAFPLLSIMMMSLDVLVLYALNVRWDEAWATR